ncbi:SulP family inorganic anion transporter [Methylobacillus methanolivorans]|uniref:SulP family inorganic anion transporter n=1 Tax=Methylobacillus methanolivorans TaxID=1848927 RepID=A0ABW8GME7_9PROT
MSNAVSKGLNLSQIKTNALSGLTTALAMVPETIAFAFVAHVSPLTGLYASVIVSFITSAFGGRPGMISGAAGSLAVVMTALVVQHGVEYLFAAVVLMGILQVLFGVARMGKYIRMVPYPVMLGFVNGLAMVIFFAQFNHFKVVAGDGSLQWLSGPLLYTMLGLVALTMVIIYLLPRMTKVVPSALAAIVLVSVAVAGFGLETKTVGDLGSIAGGLPSFHIPSVPFDLETLKIVFPYSLILAAIGLIETLLTLNLVDEMTNTRGQPNRESMAQGAANVATGMFSGMGGCAMIGQTMINMNAGGLHRLSGIAMSAFLLSFILFASHWIEMIPLAALIGVIFVMALKTFEWGSFRLFGKVPRPDIFVGILVALITLFSDLAVAVLIGVIVSALVFAWEHAKQVSASTVVDESGRKVYVLKGSVFFASIANFQALFTPHDDPAQVVVDFAQAKVVDHSALAAIDALAERYAQQGKQLSLKHLSPDCRALLSQAKDLVEVNLLEDPTYPVADDKLG